MAQRLPGLERSSLPPPKQTPQQCRRPAVEWDFDPPGETFTSAGGWPDCMARFPAEVYAYLGAGSCRFCRWRRWLRRSAKSRAGHHAPAAVTNNLHSSELDGAKLPRRPSPRRVERLASDNAWVVLRTEAGVAVRSLPPNAGTRVDIDHAGRPAASFAASRLAPALEHYLHARPSKTIDGSGAGSGCFRRRPGGLIGRVSSGVWAHVEANTQAWIRVFSKSAACRPVAGWPRAR
jgi:hypothetical protein